MTALTAVHLFEQRSALGRAIGLNAPAGTAELTFSVAHLAGASLGFLWFNAPRRKFLWANRRQAWRSAAHRNYRRADKQEFML